MKLIKARITNFRSAEDSEAFSVDQVTCLVGKNEAGKSAILLALAALNPHPSTPAVLEKERDYPRRHLTAYSERHPSEEAIAACTEWQLSTSELEQVEKELGQGVIKNPVMTVFRRYQATGPEWKLQLDETFADQAHTILAASFPTFMYFSNYDRMDGAVQFEQLQQLKASGQINQDDHSGTRLFLEFLEYAGVPLEDILNVTTYETFNARLQAASNNLTDQILEYWTQNPDLEVRVDVRNAKPGDKPPFNDGTVGRARIYNQLHRVDAPFSERSAGFVWFFIFLGEICTGAGAKEARHPPLG